MRIPHLLGLAQIVLLIAVSPLIADSPTLEPITLENAGQLSLVGVLGRGTANALDWHPDGELLAVGSSTGVWLLNEKLEMIEETPIEQPITDVAWSPDGSRIAAVSNLRGRCTVQVWDDDFVEQQLALDYCGGEALWNAEGTYLAIFNIFNFFSLSNNEVQLIDMATNEVTTLPGQDGAWSPSGDVLFTRLRTSRSYYEEAPTIYTWDVDTKKELFALDITDNQSGAILWGLDDRTLAMQCVKREEDTDRVSVGLCGLDVRTGESTLIREITSFWLGQCVCVFEPYWNDSETMLAYVSDNDTRGFLNSVLVLDRYTNEITHIGYGEAFDWKPGSNLITTIVGNGEIHTYDAETGELITESKSFTAPINMIAIRPNSNQIASASFGYQQDTTIWDISNSWVDSVLSFFAEPAEIVDYTPDGSELIAGGTITTDIVVNQQIDAFDPDTGERIRNIAAFYDQGASPSQQNWNASYTQFAEVNADGGVTLPNGVTIETAYIVEYVSWSPDDTMIATVERIPNDYSFYIRTWDSTTGEDINMYAGGMFAFRGLVWSPGGTQIAVMLEHQTGSNIYVRGLRVFSILKNENYEFDRHDYQVFADVNIDEIEQQAHAVWNNQGTMLAVAISDRLEIHKLDDNDDPLVSLPAYDIVDLEWSEDDKLIAGGSVDGTIRLWGVPSTEE